MATKAAAELKRALMNEPEEHFETLTFKEVGIGQQFICLPLPGDNKKYGGFRKEHRLFRKLNEDRAVNTKTGFDNMIPESVDVILIE